MIIFAVNLKLHVHFCHILWGYSVLLNCLNDRDSDFRNFSKGKRYICWTDTVKMMMTMTYGVEACWGVLLPIGVGPPSRLLERLRSSWLACRIMLWWASCILNKMERGRQPSKFYVSMINMCVCIYIYTVYIYIYTAYIQYIYMSVYSILRGKIILLF